MGYSEILITLCTNPLPEHESLTADITGGPNGPSDEGRLSPRDFEQAQTLRGHRGFSNPDPFESKTTDEMLCIIHIILVLALLSSRECNNWRSSQHSSLFCTTEDFVNRWTSLLF